MTEPEFTELVKGWANQEIMEVLKKEGLIQ